jgi:protein-tyrosine phosphatase
MAGSIGRIDVHSHLLPGIDDGCQDYEQSFACARMLVDAGYTHAFCTPHVWPQLPKNTMDTIVMKVAELQQRLDQQQIPLTVLPGGEINLIWGWAGLQGCTIGHVFTYAMEGRYALFDFWAETLEEFTRTLSPAIAHLRSLGLKLILAHPERVAALQSDPRAIDWFLEREVLLQMNTWCLTTPRESPVFQLAHRLLREDRYFLFGTDCHDAQSMPSRIEGVRVAEDIVGRERIDQLTRINPLVLATRLNERGRARPAEHLSGSPR